MCFRLSLRIKPYPHQVNMGYANIERFFPGSFPDIIVELQGDQHIIVGDLDHGLRHVVKPR